MTTALTNGTTGRLTLHAEKAADLMAANPISLRDSAPVAEALALLTRKGFHAAPVIGETGKPVGVLSYTDLVVHERARCDAAAPGPDEARVRDLMTPAVFAVPIDAPARRVVGDLVALKVHQLYVVDKGGVLVGVISTLDVLRHMKEHGNSPSSEDQP